MVVEKFPVTFYFNSYRNPFFRDVQSSQTVERHTIVFYMRTSCIFLQSQFEFCGYWYRSWINTTEGCEMLLKEVSRVYTDSICFLSDSYLVDDQNDQRPFVVDHLLINFGYLWPTTICRLSFTESHLLAIKCWRWHFKFTRKKIGGKIYIVNCKFTVICLNFSEFCLGTRNLNKYCWWY